MSPKAEPGRARTAAPELSAPLVVERGVSDGDTVVAYDDQWGLAAGALAGLPLDGQ